MLNVYVGVAILFIVGLVIVYFSSKWQTHYGVDKTTEGVVVSMTYTPEDTDTSVVPTFNSNGGFGVGISSHTHDEQHIVVVRSNEFPKIVIDGEKFFNDVKPGDKVTVVYAAKSKIHKDTGELKGIGDVVMRVKSNNVDFIFEKRPEEDK